MHLLQLRDDQFSLAEFVGSTIPAYAILSHCWLSKDEELLYQDILQKTGQAKKGYKKLVFCAEQAARDGLEYFWIDTCCIDKTSSASLAEAITSMFKWYQNSAQCYAYLPDVSIETSIGSKRKADHEDFNHTWESAFRASRWFKRGWTLQELIAPRQVKFFSKEGRYLGDKTSLEQLVHSITRIPVSALRGTPLDEFDIEQRMSWIGDRQTTREEDGAYSMLGILGVSMVPLYGEGKDGAFRRLRREVSDASSDRPLALNREVSDTSSGRPLALNEEQRQALMESLRFEQIDARQMTIKNAHAKTCKWLLKNREYLDWLDVSKLDEHHGFLWIKGKAGAGKSTLMKYALINARKGMNDCITLSFFFNARGEEIEKSTIGTYRSLLLQLLERLPALQSTFDLLRLSATKPSASYQWSTETLKMLLEQALQNLGTSHLVCFIDALDECDEESVRDMVQFFERIGETAASRHSRIHICFSSRHYPYITIRRGLELVLEGQEGHAQDITNYIESELKIGQSRVAKQIRSEVQEKASGIFMWVVLVVGILNKTWDRGQIHALRRKLQEIPSDLHELFRDILTRDSQNKDDLVLCIQWVLFATQPLSLKQFYHAILSGTDPDALSALDSEEISKDVLKRFILDCSKGLVETTASKMPRVQFIHESVRDYLLKENGLGKIWPELGDGFQAQSHERLKQCCFSYIHLSYRFCQRTLLNLTFYKTSQYRPRIVVDFPLLEYAVQNVLFHADAAEGGGVSQIDFLKKFPSKEWLEMDWLLQMHGVRRHTLGTSCLYLLAEFNMVNLIKAFPSVSECLQVEKERYGCPLLAAAAMGSDQALKVLLEAIRTDPIPQQTLDAAAGSIQQHIANRRFQYSQRKGLLWNAAEFGNDSILTHIVNSGRLDLDLKDRSWTHALDFACWNGCVNAVDSILRKNPKIVNGSDRSQSRPLYIAAELGNDAMVKLLLKHGAEVDAAIPIEGTALRAASRAGHKQVVKTLLEHGADIYARAELSHLPIDSAALAGHMEIVDLLKKGHKKKHIRTD